MRTLKLALLSLAVISVGCTASTEEESRDLSRPAYTTLDLPDDRSAWVEDRIVVDFEDGTSMDEVNRLEGQWGIDLELANEEEGVDSAITVADFAGSDEERAALLRRIAENPGVEVAEPLMRFTASYVPNDPLYASQWNMQMINMPKAWDGSRGKGVIVAVLDTGIAYEDHDDFLQVPDLKGARFVEGYDFVNRDAHANDDHGHGTHVAGTIAQATNNGEGVAGVAFEATLMPVKVLDAFGTGSTITIADAIRWAADHGAKVINMSLGGGGRSLIMERAVTYARSKGVVVVCAAGNGGRGIVEFPAAYPGAVAVSAVGPTGTKAPYSSFGKELDIAAPGGDKTQGEAAGIVQNTIDPRNISRSVYASYQGTSMATPHVAGVAALLYAAGAKTPDQVEQALFTSARPPSGATGWTDQLGHGLVDAAGALARLKALKAADVSALLPEELGLAQDGTVAEEPGEVRVYSYQAVSWAPFGWAAGLLALVLLTLGRKERPGYLNVLVSPGFIVPMALTTLGIFVVQYFIEPNAVTTAITLPLPDWLNRIIFGRGALANPIVYSAALPIVGALIGWRSRGVRQAVGGLALGFAGILAYSAWAQAPALAWLPFTFLAIPWLVVNALISLVIARAMLRKEG